MTHHFKKNLLECIFQREIMKIAPFQNHLTNHFVNKAHTYQFLKKKKKMNFRLTLFTIWFQQKLRERRQSRTQ